MGSRQRWTGSREDVASQRLLGEPDPKARPRPSAKELRIAKEPHRLGPGLRAAAPGAGGDRGQWPSLPRHEGPVQGLNRCSKE